jgi:hypothetical protein
MPFYWSLSSIPELANLTKARRREIWGIAWPKARRDPQFWLGILISVVVSSVGPLLYVYAFHGRGKPDFLFIISCFILPPFGSLLANQIFFRAALPHVRAEIGGLCIQCGYDLRATPTRCPECGHAALSSR